MKDDVTKLISDAATALHSRGGDGMTRHVGVEYPACVLYYGEGASSFHNGIFETLQNEWGNVTSLIPFYTILDPDLSGEHALKDMQTNNEVDAKAFQQAVMDVQNNRNSKLFNSQTQIEAFCVVDTRGMAPEDFRKWYACIESIQNLLGNVVLNTLLIVLLSNTVGEDNVSLITQELADIYEGKELGPAKGHLYEGVLLYGNQCWNKAFNGLFDEQVAWEHNDRDVLADVIMLADSQYDATTANPKAVSNLRSLLFSTQTYPVVTVALKQVEKPCLDIAMASLWHVVKQLDESFTVMKSASLEYSKVLEVLGFQEDGHFQLSDLFNQQIDAITKNEFGDFEYGLPLLVELASITDVSGICELSYGKADNKTGGCLSAFVENNHLRQIDKVLSDGSNGIDKLMRERVTSTLTAPQLLSLSKSAWEQYIEKAFVGVQAYDPKRLNVHDFIDRKLRQRVAKRAHRCVLEIISELYDKAEQVEREFNALKSDVSFVTSSVDPALDSFYGKKVNSFCVSGGLQEVQRHVFALDGDRKTMVEAIRTKGLKQLFSYTDGKQSIFSLGFMNELTLRMADGRAQATAQTVIGADLVKDISDLVGYCSMHPLDYQQIEAYLLHVDTDVAGIDWASSSGKLYSYLNKRAIPNGTSRVFLNIGRKDIASSLWFYALGTQHLRG